MAKFDLTQSAILAGLITGSAALVSWVFGYLGQVVQPLFVTVPAATTLTTSMGNKLLGWIGGIVPIGSLGAVPYLALFASSFVAVVTGNWIISSFKTPILFNKGLFGYNGNAGRIFSVILYGSIVPYIVLVGMSVPANLLMTIVGFVVYTFPVALGATWLASVFKIKI